MEPAFNPWTELPVGQNLMAFLRSIWLGREVFRVSVGPDWLRIHLVGPEKPGLVISSRPGGNLVFAVRGPWPRPLRQALPLAREHLLDQLLTGGRLTGLGFLPADRVVALRLTNETGQELTLLHQLFGSRGNTTLLDPKAKLLWARHQLPHALLANLPPPETWSTGVEEMPAAQAEIIFEQLFQTFQQKVVRDLIHTRRSALNRALATADRLLVNLARDLENAEQGEHYRRVAEALAGHLHTLVPGQSRAEIHDLRDGSPLSVELDPSLTPAANLESWFRKARKADKGRQVIAQNLADKTILQEARETARAELEELSTRSKNLDTLAEILQWDQRHASLLPSRSPGGGKRSKSSPEEPARPFRRYLIDGKWEAWVGRNNKENDQLTHRASHNRDIWLHAQGVAGSHVILRTGGKPEQVPPGVLAKAAALAALNSKAKHSALVPVIHTERRYVRKPRKSPPGLAVCLREKSIFVEPGVGSGVVPI